jgi:6-phosphogluconolactonase (cycloisomerase 2 family)
VDLATGAFAPIATVSVDGPRGMAADPTGRFLYTVVNLDPACEDRGCPRLVAYRRHDSGALTEIGRFTVPDTTKVATLIAVSDRFAFVKANDSSTGYSEWMAVYRRLDDGTLTFSGNAASRGGCWCPSTQLLRFLAVDPAGRRAYEGAAGVDKIVTYAIEGTGALTRTGDASSESPVQGAVHPSGRWLLVAGGDRPVGFVSSYAIDNAGLPRPAGSIDAAGLTPSRIALDPKGRFLYAIADRYDPDSQGILSYTLDVASGALRHASSPIVLRDPSALAVDPTGRFLYVATSYGVVMAFAIDGTSGALTEVGELTDVRSEARELVLVGVP